MKIIVCALVGLIIFVSQTGTVVVVGDLAVQEAMSYNHPVYTRASTAGGLDASADKLVVLRESANSPTLLNATRLQLVGPKRGPVK